MAKFTYRMQNILDIKSKLENQAKAAYGIAQQKYQEQQNKLSGMIIRRNRYEKELKSLMDGTLDMQAIKEAKDAVDSMKVLIRRQMMEVHKAELELEAARKALSDMMQERKMHEKLKEKAFEEFKQELLAEEGKEIDGLVSYTYNAK